MNLWKKLKREEGQGLVEYALVLVLVAVIVIVILTVLGSSVVLVYARVIGGFSGQTITGVDKEGIVVSAGGSSSCDVSFVLTNGGSIVTDQQQVSVEIAGTSKLVDIGSSGIGKVSLGSLPVCSVEAVLPLSW